MANLQVMGQTANPTCLIPDLPRMIYTKEAPRLRADLVVGGRAQISIPKNAQKPLDVLANDTYIKHISFVPFGFICKWYFHVFSIVMIEEKNQK